MAAPAMNDFPYITRVGVELELCVRTDGDCMSVKDAPTTLTSLTSQEKFDLYFANLLFPRRAALAGLQTRIVFEDDYGDFYFYDLESGEKHKWSASDLLTIEKYTFIKFIDDLTIVCGDEYDTRLLENTWNENRESTVQPHKSFRMECITPILEITDLPSRENIAAALMPYLIFFGLDNPACFMSNSSAGFHVNVSIVEKATGKMLPIGAVPLLYNIVNEYLPIEKEMYTTRFRSRKPLKYAHKNYMALWAKPLYWMESRAALERNLDKGMAIKVKLYDLLEFRVFQSEKDPAILLENVLIALDVVYGGIFNGKTEMAKKRKSRRQHHKYGNPSFHLRNATRRRNKRRTAGIP
jgi:hypothetical protein